MPKSTKTGRQRAQALPTQRWEGIVLYLWFENGAIRISEKPFPGVLLLDTRLQWQHPDGVRFRRQPRETVRRWFGQWGEIWPASSTLSFMIAVCSIWPGREHGFDQLNGLLADFHEMYGRST